MELWEEKLQSEPYRLGIATLPLRPRSQEIGAALGELEAEADAPRSRQVPAHPRRQAQPHPGARARHPRRLRRVGVVQFDAHADLREEYEGTP